MHSACDIEDPATADPVPFAVGPSVADGKPIVGPAYPAWTWPKAGDTAGREGVEQYDLGGEGG